MCSLPMTRAQTVGWLSTHAKLRRRVEKGCGRIPYERVGMGMGSTPPAAKFALPPVEFGEVESRVRRPAPRTVCYNCFAAKRGRERPDARGHRQCNGAADFAGERTRSSRRWTRDTLLGKTSLQSGPTWRPKQQTHAREVITPTCGSRALVTRRVRARLGARWLMWADVWERTGNGPYSGSAAHR